MKLIGTSILAIVLVAGISLVGMYVSYSNNEVTLRNQITAVQKSNEAVFDNTWKIIKEQCKVADKYQESFKQIYVGLMDARYSKGDGALMKWITESNPQFDTKLYEKVSNNIEAQRTVFTNDQKKLLDLKREHDNLRTMIPAKFFVGSRPEILVTIVTSTRSDAAFKTGKDDESLIQ